MCHTNNEKKVCNSSVEHLLVPGTRITFGPGCVRTMWQHVIRSRLCPHRSQFKRWDDIAPKLYAVRPDGSPCSSNWDLMVRPKIQAAMNRYASEAVKKGLVREEDGERVWENWTKGFLSDEWDGSTFTEDYARSLLQKMSDAEDAERRSYRRRPVGVRPRSYPALYKYFLGGDRPSPAIEARVLEVQRPYL
uniref:Uncharacterized protein n=1 Tax=Colletotrichum fructicola (strain Nara gc5) TaxID=1213859 RepID=L2FPT7_COLFN